MCKAIITEDIQDTMALITYKHAVINALTNFIFMIHNSVYLFMMALQDMKAININNIFAICFTMTFGSSFGVLGSSNTEANKPFIGEDRNIIKELCDLHMLHFKQEMLSNESINTRMQIAALRSQIGLDAMGSINESSFKFSPEDLQRMLLNRSGEVRKELENTMNLEEELLLKLKEELDLVKKNYIGYDTVGLMNALAGFQSVYVELTKCIKGYSDDKSVFVFNYATMLEALYDGLIFRCCESILSLQERYKDIQDMVESAQKRINTAQGNINRVKEAIGKYKNIAQDNKQHTREEIPVDDYRSIISVISENIVNILIEYKFASEDIKCIRSKCRSYNRKYISIRSKISDDCYELFKVCDQNQSTNIDSNCVQELLCNVKAVKGVAISQSNTNIK